MSILRWRQEFEVGVDEVDEDHRELIGGIRTLHRQLPKDASAEQTVAVLRAIYALVTDHFAQEEELMRETRYPALAEHKQDHETLLDDLREIMAEVEDDGILDDTQLTDDLDRWFSDHFNTHDAQLHRGGRRQG